MLILSKTSIKTTILLILFIFWGSFLQASSNVVQPCYGGSFDHLLIQEDTIKTPVAKVETSGDFVIPERLKEKIFEFQINSEITYLSFRHFVKPEAKKSFFDAWIKEQETRKLEKETDSLRKIYAHASDDQKEQIAAIILKNEQQSIAFNNEIPAMYENARNLENQFWQTATAEMHNERMLKISQFRDSLELQNRKKHEQSVSQAESSIDTLILQVQTTQPAEAKAETVPEIVYKIQIGAFKGKIPETSNKLIKKLSLIRKVENYVDEKGVKVYTTGNLRLYQEAQTLLNQVKQEGVKNPIIAAYHKGKRVPVEEAKKLNKEQ